jgi:hypothetical protein
MKQILSLSLLVLVFGCNDQSVQKTAKKPASVPSSSSISGHWNGSFTNGMKQTFISFDVSEDGKELKELTFTGYWRCDGKLDQTTLGPKKTIAITDNKADGVITEPEGGGATAIRYELHASFNGDHAQGSFRMNINALGCDTYKLEWSAVRK